MAAQTVKDFNQLLEALIQQVSPLIGNNYHFLFKGLIKANAILPIQTFNQYALEWKDRIQNRDESFFLREDVVQGVGDENAISEIFQLQGVWNTLDDKSKDNLWEILQALLMLGENYHNLKN